MKRFSFSFFHGLSFHALLVDRVIYNANETVARKIAFLSTRAVLFYGGSHISWPVHAFVDETGLDRRRERVGLTSIPDLNST